MDPEPTQQPIPLPATPKVNLGVAWNPLTQLRTFEIVQSEILTGTEIDPVLILPANPARVAFTVFFLTGDRSISLFPGNSPSVANAVIETTNKPFTIHCAEYPGLVQMAWTAKWSWTQQIIIYECVALY